jgi:NCAIR mutase (PurE)-related protein
MREILDALAAGELTPEEAQAKLQGYAATDAGRFDAARERRSGVPEAVLAEGKPPRRSSHSPRRVSKRPVGQS